MSIWRAMRYRVRTAAGIVLAFGVVVVGAAAVASPAQAQPVLRLPPRAAAVSWGDNQDGQLGDGTTTARATYAGVSGLSSGVAQVSAGSGNSMALTTGGTVWTWGDGVALGTGSAADSTVPVQVPGLAGVTQIAAGSFGFDLALRSDGTVWGWGLDVLGQLGDGSTVSSRAPVEVSGLTGVTQIAAGDGFGLALRSDSTVWAWGWNRNGVLGDGATAVSESDVPVQVTGLSNVIQIAAGATSAMAVRVQARRGSVLRTVWTWGNNGSGQLGDGTTTDSATPVEVSGINAPSVTAISAGGGFSMVLGSDGSVWGWGENSFGELGNGTTTNELRPVEILVGAVTGISAGQSHALVLLRGGSVLAWGTGQSGTGSFSLTPEVVPSLAGVTQISAGNDYSLAVHQVVLVFVPGGVSGTLRR
jgi:alpha-tubulin suppressor-like RCC1 family protein